VFKLSVVYKPYMSQLKMFSFMVLYIYFCVNGLHFLLLIANRLPILFTHLWMSRDIMHCV